MRRETEEQEGDVGFCGGWGGRVAVAGGRRWVVDLDGGG